jgi:predicted N-acetyltransferase YhbS
MSLEINRAGEDSIENILQIECAAFIPELQATRDKILERIRTGSTYLLAELDGEKVGTIAFRKAQFSENFNEFIKKYPTFQDYAEKISQNSESNAFFIYNLGVIPEKRNGIIAKHLITAAINIAKSDGIRYIVGDGRIPSINGSSIHPQEHVKKNMNAQNHVNKEFIDYKKHDPVVGFYFKILPSLKVLGLTDSNFIPEDVPSDGRRLILYSEVNK